MDSDIIKKNEKLKNKKDKLIFIKSYNYYLCTMFIIITFCTYTLEYKCINDFIITYLTNSNKSYKCLFEFLVVFSLKNGLNKFFAYTMEEVDDLIQGTKKLLEENNEEDEINQVKIKKLN